MYLVIKFVQHSEIALFFFLLPRETDRLGGFENFSMMCCHRLSYKTEHLILWTETLPPEAKVIPLKEGRKRCADLDRKNN